MTSVFGFEASGSYRKHLKFTVMNLLHQHAKFRETHLHLYRKGKLCEPVDKYLRGYVDSTYKEKD